MGLPPEDFESSASTNFTTPAQGACIKNRPAAVNAAGRRGRKACVERGWESPVLADLFGDGEDLRLGHLALADHDRLFARHVDDRRAHPAL